MKRLIVSIRDVKLGEYLGLSLTKNTAETQRHFMTLVTQDGNAINKFPRDYQVHIVGTFDTELGALMSPQNVEDVTPYCEVDIALQVRDQERKNALIERLRDELPKK